MKRLVLLLLAALATAAAQPTLSCTVHTLAGTYSVSYVGYVTMAGASPMSFYGTILGVFSINYDGTVTGADAVSGFGPVTDYVVSGTVEVNPDCTGTIKLKAKPKNGVGPEETEVHRFIFDPDGATLLATMTDLGPDYYPAILGTWKRISRWPNGANW